MANHTHKTLLLTVCLIGWNWVAEGESARELVAKGNAAYRAGKYDEALALYENASIAAPDSPHIHFNKGDACYQNGDYTNAAAAFEQAALKSQDRLLTSRSKYNLGNCSFRNAERQRDSDLHSTLALCTHSLRQYQEALELDLRFTNAAQNVEVVRLYVKALLDEIKEREEAKRGEQQAAQNRIDKLKQLLERQEKAAHQCQALSGERKQRGESPAWKEQVQALAQDQQQIQKETVQMAEQMGQGPQPQPARQASREPSAEQAQNLASARRHLEQAASAQSAATKTLGQKQSQEARSHQSMAQEKLEAALELLSENHEDQKSAGPRQQRPRPAQQKAASAQKQTGADQKGKVGRQQGSSPLAEEAPDILNEERENRASRHLVPHMGYRPVERDW